MTKFIKDKIFFDQKQTPYDYIFQGRGPGYSFVLSSNSAKNFQEYLNKLPEESVGKVWFHDWFVYAFFRFNNLSWFLDNESHILFRQHDTNVLGAHKGIKTSFNRFISISSKEYRKQVIFLSKIIGYKVLLPLKKINILNYCLILSSFKARRKPIQTFILFISSLIRVF